jgi:hypothetical protein
VRIHPLGDAFPTTFEETAAALSRLDRLFFEPDGSFVWTDGRGSQLDGTVFDRDEHVVWVDARGVCPSDVLNHVLSSVGWPGTPIRFEMVRQGRFLDDLEFRRTAAIAAAEST